ncbi:hypothetical protein BDY21DRAFT_409767 [Lineolata rhizophorae]|uniref:tRNA 4-demethylwyosine synthase (AdoMet-dependent) n=1 Tax=Lineolata rhizophorae TaxID=578093 RepID=A0A6A6P546_9PEZI|nr:hypothetical protein BDY21DRAFT_409767 [Lineolata rhizophorae]
MKSLLANNRPPTVLLDLWHGYRVPVILSTLTLLFAVRVVLRARWHREKVSVTPPVGSPKVHGMGTTEQKSMLTEKETPRILSPETLLLEKEVESNLRTNEAPRRQRQSPKRVAASKIFRRRSLKAAPYGLFDAATDKIQPIVFFASVAGSTEKTAGNVARDMEAWVDSESNAALNVLKPILHDLFYVDYDDYFISGPPSPLPNTKHFYIFLLPTYNIDTALTPFLDHLRETHHDFRINTAPLSALIGYSVFGFGDQEGWPTEAEGFCSQAKEVDKWMAKLTGRKRAFPMGTGDVKSDALERLKDWREGVQEVLVEFAAGKGLGEGVPGSGDAVESDEEDGDGDSEDADAEQSKTSTSRRTKKVPDTRVDDVEDLGRMVSPELAKTPPSRSSRARPLAIDFTTKITPSLTVPVPSSDPKPMVPKESPTYSALTKQGYSIIGTHSGVKICRWTKSALRGRGSCYKYSFYGIASHQCMEATPSLSCSNKCVFCWRHGTNPVGTTWRWSVDPPDLIFSGALAAHVSKIKSLKGVPGVRAERFAEALRVRHCALSLVGEPLFYPHINALLSLLHGRRISSFLVCNAQHPAQLAALARVTQLYVSIDASDAESLRRVDRPLHRDYWPRFLACLDILRERRAKQRTVFRLTLVKGFNFDKEADGYAALVTRGVPAFVEIKGVTYCGTSSSSAAGLTMQNVPFWEEVAAFAEELVKRLNAQAESSDDEQLRYGIAAEHRHSCCVLLACERRFKRNGRWCSRIDYDRFFDLLEERGEEGDWGPEDYMGEDTPEWALWGNGGFDPRDTRVDRKGRPVPKA